MMSIITYDRAFREQRPRFTKKMFNVLVIFLSLLQVEYFGECFLQGGEISSSDCDDGDEVEYLQLKF